MNLAIFYWQFPEFDKHAGALRLFEFVKILINQGHIITFLSDYRHTAFKGNQKYKVALENLGVECISIRKNDDTDTDNLKKLLNARQFQAAIFEHYFIFNFYSPFLREIQPGCKQILDTVDLHFIRQEREANIIGSKKARLLAKEIFESEFKAILNADSIWVVTEKERELILENNKEIKSPIHVVPSIHKVTEGLNKFNDRSGIIFIGGYYFTPNADAIEFYSKEIYPLILKKLPNVRITILGCWPLTCVKRYKKKYSNMEFIGFVKDHKNILNSHLIGIAPLRFGAGMKGKIGEYLSCGLPIVTTSIGAEGFNFRYDEAIIADDPISFSNGVVKLYKNKEIWKVYSKKGIRYVERFSPQVIAEKIKTILQ